MIDRRDERERLKQDNERRGERAHKREPISRPNHDIKKRDRPSDEDNHFEQIGDGTAPNVVAANREKRRLKNETKTDCEEIEPRPAKRPMTQLNQRVRDCGHETNCRNNKNVSIHWSVLF